MLRPAIVAGSGAVSRRAVLRVICRKVSTSALEQAIARESAVWARDQGVLIIRIFLFVLLAGVVAIAGGVLMLGMFPPSPQPHAIEKVVPNDKFGAH